MGGAFRVSYHLGVPIGAEIVRRRKPGRSAEVPAPVVLVQQIPIAHAEDRWHRFALHRASDLGWPPPVGRDLSHAVISSDLYRTELLILRYLGPCRRKRHRRTDATDKPVTRATSCSFRSI